MSAAENKYPDPPEDEPQWLALAQATFNSQVARWDPLTCGGGLRWQIFTFNNGYNYKNTISNGCFFNLAARLAMYTGNNSYAEWAEKMYDWTEAVGLMNDKFQFYDGTDTTINCTNVNRIQWSYNAANYLIGAANMYNFTDGDEKWKTRLQGILDATSVFFDPANPNIMYEVACESNGKCNVDQRSFKAYLSRWMTATMKAAPFTRDFIMPRIRASAAAAARVCTGGDTGTMCALRWTLPAFSGEVGVGEQMAALEIIQSNLIDTVPGPVSEKTGGTSKGDAAAGTGGDELPDGGPTRGITTGDRVGAGFLTTLILVGVLGGAWWMIA
ncbi:MAG: hydrolase 76 protein [Piccolia ochrophora]|nr:MAG: hydrolase 76 protein [Piccolia ochrophora]